MTKLCSKCGIKYPATTEYFNRDKNQTSGLTCACKICITKRDYKYRLTHKAQIKSYHQKYNRDNKDKRRGYARKAYIKHKVYYKNRLTKYNKTMKGHIVHIVASIKQRCTNLKNPRYKDYGGSGIRLHFDSQELYDWCVKNKIDPRGLEIHRKVFDGHYCLDNIEFISKSEHTSLHNLKGH